MLVKGEKSQKSCISVAMVANHSESIIFPECKADTRRIPIQTEKKTVNINHKKNYKTNREIRD